MTPAATRRLAGRCSPQSTHVAVRRFPLQVEQSGSGPAAPTHGRSRPHPLHVAAAPCSSIVPAQERRREPRSRSARCVRTCRKAARERAGRNHRCPGDRRARARGSGARDRRSRTLVAADGSDSNACTGPDAPRTRPWRSPQRVRRRRRLLSPSCRPCSRQSLGIAQPRPLGNKVCGIVRAVADSLAAGTSASVRRTSSLGSQPRISQSTIRTRRFRRSGRPVTSRQTCESDSGHHARSAVAPGRWP